MFCNNCGNQIKEGEKFCVKCGNSVVTKEENLTCEKCGKPIEARAKFCNYCGASLAISEKIFCRYCGQQFDEGESFCKNCGKPYEEKSQFFENLSGKLSNLGGKFGEKLSKLGRENENVNLGISSTGAIVEKESSLNMKHLILAGLFTLLLIFWFIPSITITAQALFISESCSISMGAPYDDDNMEMVMEYTVDDFDALKTATTVLVIFFDVIPVIASIALLVLPIIRKTVLKRRRFIYQKIIIIKAFIEVITRISTYKSVCEQISDSFGKASASFNFGGWLLIILIVAMGVFTYLIGVENKKNCPANK